MDIRSVTNTPAALPANGVGTASTNATDSATAAVNSENSGSGGAGSSGGSGSATSGKVATGAFMSPVLRYDQVAHVAVLYYRDTVSGKTTIQIPTEQVVEEYRRTAIQKFNGAGDASGRTGGNDSETSGMSIGGASSQASGSLSASLAAAAGSAVSGGTTRPASASSGSATAAPGGGNAKGRVSVSV